MYEVIDVSSIHHESLILHFMCKLYCFSLLNCLEINSVFNSESYCLCTCDVDMSVITEHSKVLTMNTLVTVKLISFFHLFIDGSEKTCSGKCVLHGFASG